ncbi:MAG TPA: VWA domain-containing protein [Chitinivibrionales bacterium]|jgi:Ca-activated chloride channel family protein|nr:VWA domain-containing protein [Chitinivibrionales bacterium]
MQLRDPWYLLLLVAWIPMVWVYVRREKNRPAVRFSDLSTIRKIRVSRFVHLRHVPFVLRCAGIGLLAVALARPQQGTSEEEVTTEGVDIMLVLDVSFSMRSLDFQPNNRLFVAKETIKDFIAKRRNDRIGLVIFAKRSYTKCPLTLDYNVLSQFVDKIDFEDFGDATAIGTAIATVANRLKDTPAKSKVVILLTDGGNNFGEIAPLAAAKAAGELGIKIYTIGVGREGMIPYPMQIVDQFTGKVVGTQIQNVQSDLDEQLLADIAAATGGKFFRAQNAEKLREIYDTIDKMEKTAIKTKLYTSYADRFFPWLIAGCVLLFAESLLSNTWFRRIP